MGDLHTVEEGTSAAPVGFHDGPSPDLMSHLSGAPGRFVREIPASHERATPLSPLSSLPRFVVRPAELVGSMRSSNR